MRIFGTPSAGFSNERPTGQTRLLMQLFSAFSERPVG